MVTGILAVSLVALLVLGAGLLALSRTAHDNARRIGDLEEVLRKRRHTYATADGLEDALAVAIEQLLTEQREAEYRQARLRQLQGILGMVREGPLAYDSERPADRPRKGNGKES